MSYHKCVMSQSRRRVQYATIQYLKERADYEDIWLDNLKNSAIPVTMVWGTQDEIAPTAVANYVWTTFLEDRQAAASYWHLPGADHYLQNDNPLALSLLIRQALGEDIDLSKLPSKQAPIEIEVNPGN